MKPLEELSLELLAACPEGNAAASPLNAAMAALLAGRLSPEGIPDRWRGLGDAESSAEAAGAMLASAVFVPAGIARKDMPPMGRRESVLTYGDETEARRKGDAWISEATAGLLAAAPISSPDQEHVTLISAAGFKGTWRVPFDRAATKVAPFASPVGEFRVPMMTRQGTMGYAAGPGWKAVTLDYEGGMQFVALVRSDGIPDVGALLGATSFRYPKVRLALPRFAVETTLDLLPTSIGKEAGERPPYLAVEGLRGDIVLEKAEHSCCVRTDESGTVATATTEFSYLCRSAIREEVEDAVFDRPFAFAIRTAEGVPVFVGRVTEPERA